MDRLSQSFFGSREISVVYKGSEEAARSLELKLFDCAMLPHDYADLLGIPSNAKVIAECQHTEYGLVLVIEAYHDQVALRAHAAVAEVEGSVDFWWHQFSVGEDAPRGVATRIIARQAHYAHRYQVASLNVMASGNPNSNYVGYYVWPRLGFNRELNEDEDRERLAASGFVDVTDTNTLFQRKGGPEWWAANGYEGFAELRLQVDSQSLKMLNEYLRREGIDVDD